MADKTFLDSAGLQQVLKELGTKIKNTFVKKTDFDNLASVAKTGNYSDLNGKPQIPEIPTKISAFENDVKYLTTHQSLENYLTISEIEQKILTTEENTAEKINQKIGTIILKVNNYEGLENFNQGNIELDYDTSKPQLIDDIFTNWEQNNIFLYHNGTYCLIINYTDYGDTTKSALYITLNNSLSPLNSLDEFNLKVGSILLRTNKVYYNFKSLSLNIETQVNNLDNRLDQFMHLAALIDSPNFIGTPTAPTPTNINNSTQIATVEFVLSQIEKIKGETT